VFLSAIETSLTESLEPLVVEFESLLFSLFTGPFVAFSSVVLRFERERFIYGNVYKGKNEGLGKT